MVKKSVITCAVLVCIPFALLGGFRLLIYVNGTKEPDVTSPDGKLTAFIRTFGFLDTSHSYIYVRKPGGRANIVLEIDPPFGNVKWSPDSNMVGVVGFGPWSPQPSDGTSLCIYAYNVRTHHGYSGMRNPAKVAIRLHLRLLRDGWRWKDSHTLVVLNLDGEESPALASFRVTDTGKRIVVRRL